MFHVAHSEHLPDAASESVGRFLFTLGKRLVRGTANSIGVVVSSDYGGMELAALSAGALLETLSSEFASRAAPISVLSWLQRQPDGVILVERLSRKKWQKVPRVESDAAGAVRFAPVKQGKVDSARIFSGDPDPKVWELAEIALGIEAQKPWSALEQLPQSVASGLDLEGATRSVLALYMVVGSIARDEIRRSTVRLHGESGFSIPLEDWLSPQLPADPRSFHRTAFVESVEELQRQLTKERLPHTASRLTVLAAGGIPGSVRRGMYKVGYSTAPRSVVLCSVLPARRIGPDGLRALEDDWNRDATGDKGGVDAARVRFEKFCEELGAPPKGIALVRA